MRKVLLGILTILMLAIMGLCIKNGIHVGPLQIPGLQEISDTNQELTKKINEANDTNEQYTSALSKLKSDITNMSNAKKDYLDLVTISTDSEIKEATQTKTYTIEYLWSRIGNHATKEGVTIKMDVTSSSLSGNEYKNLNFTVTGNYLAITNFISALENDTSLDFTIDSFDMLSKQCTFTVKDIKIQSEKTTATVSSGSSTNNTTSSKANATDTTNTVNENTVPNGTNEITNTVTQ